MKTENTKENRLKECSSNYRKMEIPYRHREKYAAFQQPARRPVIANPQGEAIHTGTPDCFVPRNDVLKLKSYALLFLAACFMLFMTDCSDKNEHPADSEIPGKPDDPDHVTYEILREYSFGDLKDAEKKFAGNALSFLNIIGNQAKYGGDVQLRVYKVMLETGHTNGSETKINLSGLLIVPPPEEGRKYRRVIAPPYTYVMEDEAPTVRVANDNLEPHIIFWLLEAYRYGYAVMIPDYPGFGDSRGQCFIPYVEKKAMVRTTARYVEAARSALEKEKYEKKGGYILSGYSLGAYVSLQLAHEFETNASADSMDVDLLLVGGAPCNLLQEADLIRASSTMPQPHLFPLALLGYKENGYPHLRMDDYLKEPYASGAAVCLDGKHDYGNFFTKNTQDLFTRNFLENEGMEEINRILDDNSVKPWKNRCRFIMTHGIDDETVYYEQAKDFAAEQSDTGSVPFSTTPGTHTDAGIWFFLRLYAELDNFD
jgi:pimeloyl-ACP methyl ester carboxylesterase